MNQDVDVRQDHAAFHGRQQRGAVVNIDAGIDPAPVDDRERDGAPRLAAAARDDLAQRILHNFRQ